MSERYLTFLVVPHDERGVRRFRLSYRRLKLVGATVCLLAVAGLSGLFAYGWLSAKALQTTVLERENARLSVENAKVERLEANLTQIEGAYRQIREMAGLSPRLGGVQEAHAEPPPALQDDAETQRP